MPLEPPPGFVVGTLQVSGATGADSLDAYLSAVGSTGGFSILSVSGASGAASETAGADSSETWRKAPSTSASAIKRAEKDLRRAAEFLTPNSIRISRERRRP